ncbi:MAG TPA: adenine phosphoribosyltransferase [Candidatus Hydrogenedens sp.]|nr:adenine phosphoribosyltransferase [Candidatus Hydrogenedens sp.]HOK09511.1 adenine phosphoribosyltransferase [Candidatus Hydrogenedens sp.]HOL18785.1 adenine phosphoribosyltransferase [Candidatus Hydrogenedens sp.]HPP58374.1 adenine phosphoribosyltransferase [Candidatus Hydrogenedens sp.]
MDLKKIIRNVPDFPKPGIQFKDITTLLLNPEAFHYAIDCFVQHYRPMNIQAIVAIESRGFIFGSAIAYLMNIPLVLARKKGKLPYEKISESFALEYGWDTIEMHIDALKEGQRTVIIDDLLATGGTASAVKNLIEQLNAIPVEAGFVVELPALKGRDALTPLPVFSLVQYDDL